MATTYWMDNNGTTAGFGTLSAAWNTAGAFWTTDSTGVAAPAARAWTTLTQDDTAQFGNTGTASTGGTSPIAAGTTVLLNSLIAQNISTNQQVISGTNATTSILSFGSTTATKPTISVQNTFGLLISAKLAGTDGFEKQGTRSLFLTSANSTMTGTIVCSTAHVTAKTASIYFSSDYAGTEFGYPLSANLDISGSLTVVSMLSQPASSGSPITGNITINTIGATDYSHGLWAGFQSLAGTTTQTFTGNITGTGNFVIPGFINGVSTALYIRVKTSTMLSGTLYFQANGTSSTNPRYPTYLYGGSGNLDITAAVRLDNFSSLAAQHSFTICNATTGGGTLTISGNITKTSSGALGANSSPLNFGSTTAADDAGDIIVSGIIQEVTDTGAINITKTSNSTTPRKLTFSGANTYKGTTTISAGTLSAQNNSALGDSTASGGAVTVSSGGTLEVTNGISIAKSNKTLTLNGTTATNGALYAPGLVAPNVSTATYTSSGFVLGSNTTIKTANLYATLTLSSAAGITGAFTLNTAGAGTVVLDVAPASTTFSVLNINAGTVQVPSGGALANGGLASSIGNGAAAAANWVIGGASSGTFDYRGPATSTNRNFTIGGNGCYFNSSGTGAMTLTGTTPAFYANNNNCDLTLGGSYGTSSDPNTTAMVLTNNGIGIVGLTKAGAGAWSMTAASHSYTGTTTVSGGWLGFNNYNNLTTNVTFSGNGATLAKVKLTGSSKTISCAAGAGNTAELISDDTGAAGNTITGSTNVTSGTLRLTTEQTVSSKPVKVTGNTNVAVSANAAIRTTTGTNQKGQMRYGGNLSFSANSALYIGG